MSRTPIEIAGTTVQPGERGFGYDPLFLVPGHEATLAEIPADEKNRISHRALASRAMLDVLRAHLG